MQGEGEEVMENWEFRHDGVTPIPSGRCDYAETSQLSCETFREDSAVQS